jgi:hypothetical protein
MRFPHGSADFNRTWGNGPLDHELYELDSPMMTFVG